MSAHRYPDHLHLPDSASVPHGERHDFLRPEGVRSRALETGRTRLTITAGAFLAVFAIIAVRMVDLSVLSESNTSSRSLPEAHLEPHTMQRADIVDRNGVVLATSLPSTSLYANGQEILNPREAAEKLVKVLPNLNVDGLEQKLSSGQKFIYLRRNLTPRQQYDINALGIPGIYFQAGERRVYPHGNLAAHLVGMTDIDNKGTAGAEQYFNERLAGSSEPLALSIDVRVQTLLRNELQSAMKEFKAIGAMGTVVDAHTGEILGMSSLPDYDPQDPPPITDSAIFNRVTKGIYELGSIMKVFNTAMALESGKVNMKSMFDLTKPVVFGGHTIKDYKSLNKWTGIREILYESSNVGSIRMAMAAGFDFQKEFYRKMGFFDVARVELPETSAPQIPNPWREINSMTASYGHGISLSSLHYVRGTTALVNGGILRPLTIVKHEEADELPKGVRVISERTSHIMRDLMRGVVVDGTAKLADAIGYEVGGKTGTADKPVNGRYINKGPVMTSFLGAFPMDDPRYVVLITLDEPQPTKDTHGFRTAGWNASKVTGNVVAQIAPVLLVAPKVEFRDVADQGGRRAGTHQ